MSNPTPLQPTARTEVSDKPDSVQRLVGRQDLETMMLTLKYIAASPDQKYGGFHIQTKMTAANALREIRRLRMAIRWALGEAGDFPMRQDDQGAYWWRTELRRRAGMSPNSVDQRQDCRHIDDRDTSTPESSRS